MFLDDLPMGDERFGDPDGHLGIVGVPDLFLGISDQRLDRREACTDRIGALGLELPPERVPDGEAEEAAFESIFQHDGGVRHTTKPWVARVIP